MGLGLLGLVLVVLLVAVKSSQASLGDRLDFFQSCLSNCSLHHCQSPEDLQAFRKWQSWCEWGLGWSCDEDCDYDCMWRTLDWLKSRDFDLVPQFHGKWPFVRVAGMQEPISVLASLANLVAVLYFRHAVRTRLPEGTEFRWLWLRYSALCVWVWVASAVYHARDTPWTEKLDYFTAFASILAALFASLARIFPSGSVSRWAAWLLVLYFGLHCSYLGFVRFHYGYNMAASVTAAVANLSLWTWWMVWGEGEEERGGGKRNGGRWSRNRWGAGALGLSVLAICLELLEFAPLWWALDAHALFHIVTIPCPLLWARFAVDDALHFSSKRIKTH